MSRVAVTVPEFLAVARPYMAEHWNGGAVHIVVADGNVSDAHTRWCVENAITEGDYYGAALALLLLSMSRSQRGRVGMLWGNDAS